jgi:hypothetical protein
MSKHSNTPAARDAAVLLRTPGHTPESVEKFLRQAAQGVSLALPAESGPGQEEAA